MSDSPMLNKMDALLKKHRGGNDDTAPSPTVPTKPAPSSSAWLPVLTDIIERGTSPATVITAAPTTPSPSEESHPVESTSAIIARPPVGTDALAEQLMNELAPRLSKVMEKQVAAELRKNLDETVANLLSQLDANVREIVRDAVTEKLKQPRDPPA